MNPALFRSLAWLADPRFFAVAFVAIVAASAIAVHFGLQSIKRSEDHARRLEHGVLALETIQRGMAEIVATDGSSTSLQVTQSGLAAATELAAYIASQPGEQQAAGSLSELLKRVARFADTPAAERQADPDAFQIEYGRLSRVLSAAAESLNRSAASAAVQRQETRDRVDRSLAFAAIGLFACLVALFYVFDAIVSQPLKRASLAVQNFADGDLTARLASGEGHSDAGRMLAALEKMRTGLIGNLLQVIRKVRDGADGVSSASSHMAELGMSLSQRTEQQSSSLEETVATFTELKDTLLKSVDAAKQASTLTDDAVTAAEQGGKLISQAVDTMQGIRASSGKIVEIIALIDGIAFQTNILALNAAVEAARAGEHGRGFAVVAGEVRSLAQRCALAAKDINGLISGSAASIQTGAQLVDQAGRTIHEVVEAIRKASELAGRIATDSADQSAGIEQIHGALAEMERVTQQNAAMVEEVAATADTLRDDSARLVQAVGTLNVGEEPAAVAPRPSEARARGRPLARLAVSA
jgi:methyl-accepting chemotaxis protein